MNEPLPPVKLVFALDGVVEHVLYTDERFAALLLSQPTVVDVSGADVVEVGWLYNEELNVFIDPQSPTT